METVFIDLLIAMIPTVLAVAFSLGVKFVLQREPMVMRWVFGKKDKKDKITL